MKISFYFLAFILSQWSQYAVSTSPYIRSRIENDTKITNPWIMEMTEIVRPEIEKRENVNFTYFVSLSYYASRSYSADHRRNVVTFFWIKIRFDEGIMHVKVKHTLYRFGDFSLNEVSLIEYRTGKQYEEPLRLF